MNPINSGSLLPAQPNTTPQPTAAPALPPFEAQLANAIALAAKQDQIVWAIFGVFWAANAALLVALFSTGDFPKQHVGLIVAFVGFLFSLVWVAVQFRAIAYFAYYEKVIDLLEQQLQIPKPLKLVGIRNKVGGVSVRPIMRGCALLSATLWFCCIVRFFPNFCS